jgi:glycosyltransferase involved in cell wall biosynthesis
MNVGGPAILVADLLRNIDPIKFEQVLVTGYCDPGEADYLEEVATDLAAIRVNGLGRSISPLKDFKAFFELIGVIRKFKPNVIHTHTAKAGVLGRLAGLIATPRAKRVHTFHGHLLVGYFSKRTTYLVVQTEKILALLSTKLVAIGNKVKQDLIQAGIGSETKFEVIFPGLQDLTVHAKGDARADLNLAVTKTYIVFVGRLTQIKRPDRLLDIAQFIKAQYPMAHLLVAGEGELYESTMDRAKVNELPMSFLGWRNDIDLILSACDIAVLCSDNEGIPLTLIQAAQAGLPIVSTDVGSVSDIVKDGENGLLTEVSSTGLIKGLSVLLDDADLRKKFGVAGQKRAQALFSSHAMVQHHQVLYAQIV